MQTVQTGPAYNTKALDKGDVIVAVDSAVVDLDSLHDALIGSDVPGSSVTLRVMKKGLPHEACRAISRCVLYCL